MTRRGAESARCVQAFRCAFGACFRVTLRQGCPRLVVLGAPRLRAPVPPKRRASAPRGGRALLTASEAVPGGEPVSRLLVNPFTTGREAVHDWL